MAKISFYLYYFLRAEVVYQLSLGTRVQEGPELLLGGDDSGQTSSTRGKSISKTTPMRPTRTTSPPASKTPRNLNGLLCYTPTPPLLQLPTLLAPITHRPPTRSTSAPPNVVATGPNPAKSQRWPQTGHRASGER